jgi:hypothetical protein
VPESARPESVPDEDPDDELPLDPEPPDVDEPELDDGASALPSAGATPEHMHAPSESPARSHTW